MDSFVAEERPSRSGTYAKVAAAVAGTCLIALLAGHMGMPKGDGRLQTAGLAQMAVAQGVPLQQYAQQQSLQDAGAPPVAPAGPPAGPPAEPMASPPMEAAPMAPPMEGAAPMAPMEGAAPMAPPMEGAAPMAPMAGAAPAPTCAAGLTPCSKPSCPVGGCWELPAGAAAYVCTCMAVPEPVEQPGATPAYVVPGSQEWLEQDQNKLQGPPPEASMASAGLAQYEAGKVAYQLDRYLKAASDKAQSQAALGKLILADVKALQPGGEPGEKAQKGLLGLGILGL